MAKKNKQTFRYVKIIWLLYIANMILTFFYQDVANELIRENHACDYLWILQYTIDITRYIDVSVMVWYGAINCCT